MKIGIVLHPYGEDKPAGLARTIFELTNGLIAIGRENEYIIYLKREPKIRPVFPGNNWRIEILDGELFWLNNLRHASPADVYIFNTPVLPLFFTPRPNIVLALDYGYLSFSRGSLKAFTLKWITKIYHHQSLKRADSIVAISEATKRDTVEIFGINPDRIRVIYCGYKKVCAVAETHVALPAKFFFFVGIIKERKNVLRLIEAFHLFDRTGNPDGCKLVIGGSGAGPYYDAVHAYVRDNALAGKVIFVGHLNDGQLSYIYRRAMALTFPSNLEGFGFPVLEAMDCGTPVITSNSSSLRELGADGAAVLVDPDNIVEISDALRRVSSDAGLRHELSRRGLERVKLFSWEKAAREFREVIAAVSKK